jgi:prepilin-type N-terminal cleavage/methylation domain-containing protein
MIADKRIWAYRSAFTLIELLIVIAIIAILSVVVILVLNPAQLLMQNRDSNRVSDMATVNEALGVYSAGGGTSLGSSNVVYISIPDPAATSTAGDQCQGLGLPSLPATYTYQCAASSTFRKMDGTGWIPVNFTSMAGGSPMGQLPIDPLNTSSSRNYFTYTTNGSQFELTAPMESAKYQAGGSNDVITNDGGTLASVYEKGTKLGLEPLDYGDNTLVGWWPLNEGTGTVAYDLSGGGTNGTWHGTPVGAFGYYSAGSIGSYAGAFDGSTNFLQNTTFSGEPTGSSALTISAWVNPSVCSSFEVIAMFGIDGGSPTGYGDYITGACKVIASFPSSLGAVTSSSTISTSTWSYVVATYTGSNNSVYINGALNATLSYSSGNILSGSINIGQWVNATNRFQGLISDVRVYNRALSSAQIAIMYADRR